MVSETLQVDAAGACLFSYLLKVEPDGYSDALCRTCAPMLSARRIISWLQEECRHPFRISVQFIVMTVMSVTSGTFPDTYGGFYMTVDCWRVRGPSRHRHVHRHRGNRIDKQLLATMTVMTLVTMNCTDILKGGTSLLPRPLSLQPARRTRRTEQGAPYLCCSGVLNRCRVFQIDPITRRRYPTRGMVRRRVYREHRRVSN